MGLSAGVTSKRRALTQPLVVAAGLLCSDAALAVQFDTGNERLNIRLDTTVRVGIGKRVEDIDPDVGNNPYMHQSDYRVKKGEFNKKRIDILPELDVVFDRKMGFRISGVMFYDDVYKDTKLRNNPGNYSGTFVANRDILPQPLNVPIQGTLPNATSVPYTVPYSQTGSYSTGEYSEAIKKNYRGPTGELLDAFVFLNTEIKGRPVSLKLGRHAQVWGIANATPFDTIGYSQQPSDLRKAAEIPGASPKETALPLNQISVQSQVTDTASLSAFYQMEWKPFRFPEGGTALGPADIINEGPDRLFLTALGNNLPLYADRVAPNEPNKRGGSFGVQLSLTPKFMGDGIVSFVYRKFDEMAPWIALLQRGDPSTVSFPNNPLGLKVRSAYAKGVELYGVSMNKTIFGTSAGAEISYRRGTALNSAPGPSTLYPDGLEGARGNTFHMVLNTQVTLKPNFLFPTAVAVIEFTGVHLDRITSRPELYKGVNRSVPDATTGTINPGCITNKVQDLCSTRTATGLSLVLVPFWPGALPGVDLTGTFVYALYGLNGTTPAAFGTIQGTGTRQFSLTADVRKQYSVGLAFTDEVPGSRSPLRDRGRVTMTLQTTF